MTKQFKWLRLQFDFFKTLNHNTMAEMTHTPEPWTYNGLVDPIYVQKCQLVLSASTRNAANIAKIIPCIGMTANEVEANAKRIVSCVNALAGIEDPKKFRDTWEGIKHLELDAYHKAAEKLQQQTAILQEVVEFAEKSRGRFCIPESLINRIKTIL